VTLPTVAGTLGVPTPAFVRKLRRRSDWGEPADDQGQRVKGAVQKLFRLQTEPDISIYLVNNDDDLRRVALGMNAGRDSLKEPVPFVAFLPAELGAAAIQASPTPGNLPCAHASGLHHDIQATDDQLAQLCATAMQKGRVVGNCSKGMMTEVIAEATKEHCRAVTDEGICLVDTCKPTC
jgi:hypothetical protein